jgi:hypothetical protein
MSLDERLTKQIAIPISRLTFLKGIGAFVAGLGLALLGKPAQAAGQCSGGCCPGTACTDCRSGGSICPDGWTKDQSASCWCCQAGCQYTCIKCTKEGESPCWCKHDDLVACPGQYCALSEP